MLGLPQLPPPRWGIEEVSSVLDLRSLQRYPGEILYVDRSPQHKAERGH